MLTSFQAYSLLWFSVLISGITGLHEIIRYNTQGGWNTAIGGTPTWCVNFNSFTVDSKISSSTGTTYADTNNVNRLIIRGTTSITSDIDAAPFGFSGSIDGTTYAALYVDVETNTRVQLTFADPNILAWSASFRGINAEGLLADIVSTQSGGGAITEEIVGESNSFFGFTIDEDLLSITFKAKNGDTSSGSGEVFSLDNICAYFPPPPTQAPAPGPSEDDDSCNIDIFLIGWIICFFLDIINFIFS